MQLQQPMRTVTSSADADVLQVLARAETAFTTAQLASITGRSESGVRLVVQRLTTQGVVDAIGVGRSRAYQLNRDHLAAGPIMALSALRNTFIDRLRNEIAAWPEQPEYAALFGSAARGTMLDGSDIDLAFVRPASSTERFDTDVDALAERAQRWTGNVVHPLILDIDDVAGRRANEPVLTDIIDEGVALAGDASAFRRLITARETRS